MKVAQSAQVGAWFLIGVNLLMAFGAIWIFRRMAPVIEVVIERNDRSLQACDAMLYALASVTGNDPQDNMLRIKFLTALATAEGNITEKEEAAVLESIRHNYETAFDGEDNTHANLATSIMNLAAINRTAMLQANHRAQQFGNAGAWTVVFMATGSFFFGLLFVRSIARSVIRPVEEINSVVTAFRNGDRMRRCTGVQLTKDASAVFRNLNGLLDMFPFETPHESGISHAEAGTTHPPDTVLRA